MNNMWQRAPGGGGGGGETCVYVTPIPPLRLNKIMAWRQQESPKFFSRIYLEKRRKGSPQLPPGHDSIQLLCKYLGKTTPGVYNTLVFNTNHNQHTDTYGQSRKARNMPGKKTKGISSVTTRP